MKRIYIFNISPSGLWINTCNFYKSSYVRFLFETRWTSIKNDTEYFLFAPLFCLQWLIYNTYTTLKICIMHRIKKLSIYYSYFFPFNELIFIRFFIDAIHIWRLLYWPSSTICTHLNIFLQKAISYFYSLVDPNSFLFFDEFAFEHRFNFV